ncbi:mediator of RNA polymerase II transcription subunit 31 [Trichomonascus vanleenenianus]|uniref:mediator complex subunit SOH1 n=1 Tax=Trichomonascus vanleenenianus TaxID=2268995 RepID=UPI003EC9DF1E
MDQETVELPTRWEVELEFIQSLANPQYLNFLAQNKYLESEEFLNYLGYLEYWRDPEYSKYIIYPNCLHLLTLLKEPRFRQDILRADIAKLFMDDFYMKWLNPANITQFLDQAKPAGQEPTIKDEEVKKE